MYFHAVIKVKKSNQIRRFLAVVLLSIFALAVTPSIIFHNILAHHTDETIQHHHTQSEELANAGINCHWDNLVCEGSFLNDFCSLDVVGIEPFSPLYPIFYTNHFTLSQHFVALRGPPAKAS